MGAKQETKEYLECPKYGCEANDINCVDRVYIFIEHLQDVKARRAHLVRNITLCESRKIKTN